MKPFSAYFKLTSILTLFFFMHACSKVNLLKEVPKERASDIKKENIIVIHHNEFSAVLDKAVLTDGYLTGYIKTYEKSSDSESLFNELHLYIDPELQLEFNLSETVTFPLEKVVKVEVYDIDTVKATGNLVLGFTGIITVFLATIGGLVLLMYLTYPANDGDP